MKILVRATNWVGDVVMSLPAVRALRASFPKAHIAVLARPWVADLYRMLPEVDRVLVEDSRGTHAGRAGKELLASELRALAIDRAICLPTSFGTAWTLYRAGIPVRIGYAGELRSPFLTRALRHPDRPGEHQVWKHIRLVEAAGAARPAALDATLPIAETDRASARTRLAETGWNGEPFVAAHVASFAHAAKRWDLGRYADLFERLAARGLPVALLGTAQEAAVNGEVAARAPRARILDLSGKSTLPEALAVLSLASGFVGNDSGVAHLASAARVPAVVIFGPTDPEATRPLGAEAGGARVEIVRSRPLCAPCRFRVCPIDHVCMSRVETDSVLAALSDP